LNVPADFKGVFGYGDVWTWTAIDADSKLIVSYMLGLRDSGYATEFMQDLADRLANRVQLTTDGLKAYLEAVEDAFGGEVDYAQLIKIYGPTAPGAAATARQRASVANQTRSLARPNVSTSAPVTLNGRIFRCEWECADSRD
jgi:transposase-like protein